MVVKRPLLERLCESISIHLSRLAQEVGSRLVKCTVGIRALVSVALGTRAGLDISHPLHMHMYNTLLVPTDRN